MGSYEPFIMARIVRVPERKPLYFQASTQNLQGGKKEPLKGETLSKNDGIDGL